MDISISIGIPADIILGEYAPLIPATAMLTETSDPMITEAGDIMVTES